VTVAMGVGVPEGLVLAADSRSTYVNSRKWPKVASDYAQKVFKLSDHVGAATFGWGFLTKKNIHSLVLDFVRRAPPEAYVEEVCQPLVDYFERRYEEHVDGGLDEKTKEAVGFIVGGYDRDGRGRLFECRIPGARVKERAGTERPGALWSGQIDVVQRLIKGVDPRLDRSKLPDEAVRALDGLEYVIHFQRMTLQDAVDFAVLMVRTTIDVQRFSDGIRARPGDAAGVGGHIDVAAVGVDGFRWVQRKSLRGETCREA